MGLDDVLELAADELDLDSEGFVEGALVTDRHRLGYPPSSFWTVGDRSFGGKPLAIGSRSFAEGLGWTANTVLIYNLGQRYEHFQSTVGVDQEVAGAVDPPASVFFTAFVNGRLAFESGAMRAETPLREVNVDVRGARILMLRMSCNWEDNGRSENDHGDRADAKLIGKSPAK